MFKITEEMRTKSNQRFEKVCKKVDNQIKRAVEWGQTSTVFLCDKEVDKDVYNRVRKAYETEGYIIKPSGYCGGVWQLTEDICW